MASKKQPKYEYLYVLQGHYGYDAVFYAAKYGSRTLP